MKRITDIEILEPYKLKVKFSDNTERICDLTRFLDKGAFKELKDFNLFKRVKNTGFSAEWPNGVDLSSDTLQSI
jgi:hypothetical protein